MTGLDLTFAIDRQILGEPTTIELVKDGSNVIVTEENKEEFVKLVCKYKMIDEIRE